jgi:hypothetical protein
MLRRSHILTTAALLAVCATPASAATWEELHSNGDVAPPPSSIAASDAHGYQDLRSPDARDAARDAGSTPEPGQDLRSPDATDAAAHRGLYEPDGGSYALNRDYGSPDAVDAARDLPPVHYPTPTVATEPPAPIVAVTESTGFDWGDAGIGAAGTLALFSIAAGSALLLMGRRRRRAVQVVTH